MRYLSFTVGWMNYEWSLDVNNSWILFTNIKSHSYLTLKWWQYLSIIYLYLFIYLSIMYLISITIFSMVYLFSIYMIIYLLLLIYISIWLFIYLYIFSPFCLSISLLYYTLIIKYDLEQFWFFLNVFLKFIFLWKKITIKERQRERGQ